MSAPITITGRLGADPELRFAASGTAIAKLRVVTNSRKKDGDQWVDVDTTWWSVTAFKQLAENIAETLTKGDLVIVVGTVKSREWEDQKTGEKRTIFEVLANHVGPDLGRAAAKISRIAREGSSRTVQVISDDPWVNTTLSFEVPF